MKSFPTSLTRGGSKINVPKASASIKDTLVSGFNNALTSTVGSLTSGRGFDTQGILYDVDTSKEARLQNGVRSFDFASDTNLKIGNNQLNPMATSDTVVRFENAFHLDQSIFNIMNNYRGYLSNVLIETGNDQPNSPSKAENYTTHNFIGNAVGSLFNPYYAVPIRGMTDNVPLIDSTLNSQEGFFGDETSDISKCSIKELCALSAKNESILGQARYKYADFMYCKDLGKISNNHLITLRRFASPVGDNIFRSAAMDDDQSNIQMAGDIGRLIAWFGTDDNKLEDILSYEYEATWKPLKAEIQQLDSQEDDDGRGPLGKLINSLTPSYNHATANGIANGGALNWLMGRMGMSTSSATYASNDVALGRNYDKNKVYEPQDTIQDTHTYEGKLIFNHEFNLTFSYKMRAYDAINPKSAFLDLLGNILTVTYRNGHFWGGKRQILGPQPNISGWKKADAMVNQAAGMTGTIIDNLREGRSAEAFAMVGGMMSNMLKSAGIDVNGLTSGIESAASKLMNGDVKGAADSAGTALSRATGSFVDKIVKQSDIPAAIGGIIKNKLGRPALYAFDSLLTGDNVGLWHVTIGNPKNPIASFGNLILTKAKITHSGPLGIDDFPTELKLTVTLKHARGRDAVDISKMYTKGENGIYISLNSPYTKVAYKTGEKGYSGSGIYRTVDTSANMPKPQTEQATNSSSTIINGTASTVNNMLSSSNASQDKETSIPMMNIAMYVGDSNVRRIRANRDNLR